MSDYNVSLLEMLEDVHCQDELGLIEAYGESNNLICSEEQLSAAFDEMVKEVDSDERVDFDDTIMLSQWFCDWSDSLCKDGQLHELQYHEYVYVGYLF